MSRLHRVGRDQRCQASMTSAAVLLPTAGAVPAARPGVRENRGAVPGRTLPSTEASVERAAR